MNNERMNPAFASALRERLVRTARERRRFGFTKWQLGLGVLAGSTVLAGGVAVASTILSQAPPGAPQDTLLANVVTASRIGTSTVALGPAPQGTTSISLTLTCRSPGTFEFPDNATESCSSQDLAQPPPRAQRAIEVIPVSPGQRSVTITATPGASWTLRAAYIKRVITPFEINAKGQSYGQMNASSGSPDLVQVVLQKNGHQGYVKSSDIDCASGQNVVKTPAEAIAWTAESKNRNVSIPIYESDGTTVIGSMNIGTPSGPGIVTVPVSSLYGQCKADSLPSTSQPSGSVEVPDVVGMTPTQAGITLSKLHLEMSVGGSGGAVPPTGHVLSQVPTAGARVDTGSVVAVRLSDG
jgi:PASTA domain